MCRVPRIVHEGRDLFASGNIFQYYGNDSWTARRDAVLGVRQFNQSFDMGLQGPRDVVNRVCRDPSIIR